jgi:ABC-2 type transport system permease protein
MFFLLLGELKRTWIQFIRYPSEVIGGLIIITSVFYGLFLSAQYMAGPAMIFGDRLDAIVVGYVLWTLALYIVNDIANTIQYEAQTGTLEQLFLSPFGAPKIFLVRAIASLLLRITLITLILLILMGITGSRLAFPLVLLLPLITLLMSAYGLAFIMGSCALVFKQVQQLLPVLQFALLFILAAPTEELQGPIRLVANCLPMLPSTGILRNLMARGQSLDGTMLAIAFANGLGYFCLGLWVFRWAERQAKRRGTLSGY